MTARRDPGGMVTLPTSGCISLPAALRHRCALLPGDQVLVAALPGEDTLATYCLESDGWDSASTPIDGQFTTSRSPADRPAFCPATIGQLAGRRGSPPAAAPAVPATASPESSNPKENLS